jgi:hypothetical protein
MAVSEGSKEWCQAAGLSTGIGSTTMSDSSHTRVSKPRSAADGPPPAVWAQIVLGLPKPPMAELPAADGDTTADGLSCPGSGRLDSVEERPKSPVPAGP